MKAVVSACLIAAALCLPVVAQAQAHLKITGGNGGPATITLVTPLQFEFIGTKPDNKGFFIIFGDVFEGLPVEGVGFSVNEGISFTLNGEGALPITNTAISNYGGAEALDFVLVNLSAMIGTVPGLVFNVGDVLELSAGTISTVENVTFALPLVDGIYEVWLMDSEEAVIFANVTAVPEPSTYALMAGGLAIAGAMLRRRRLR